MDGYVFLGILIIKRVEVCISSDCLYEYFVCMCVFSSQVNCRILCGLRSDCKIEGDQLQRKAGKPLPVDVEISF